MEIKFSIEPNSRRKQIMVTTQQLGLTDLDWHNLTYRQQEEKIDQYLETIEPPYWEIASSILTHS